MRKILLLDDYFPTGEQTVQPVLLWGPGRGRQDLSHITKTASDALDYIKNVTPEPGKTHLLLLALGSEEAYGPNRNGDGFPERPVPARHKTAGTNSRRWFVAPGEELTKHYQSFETNPAHAFKHHQNRDPKKASGQVKKAFWNGKMHRVELLIVIDNDKDPEWVQRVNDGDFPPVSMGCRIKKDVCSRCGNEAPTRAQYCDHVKFMMNHVNADGTKNYVHNPSPNFFDISRVFRPADKTGYTLKKVAMAYEIRSSAELGDVADAIERKSAAIRKISDIDKVIRGEPVASSSNLSPKEQLLIKNFRDYTAPNLAETPDLPMEELRKHSAAQVFAALASLGMMFKDAEFIEFIGAKMTGNALHIPRELARKTAALLPTVFTLFEASPALCDEIISSGALDGTREKIGEDLLTLLAPFQEKRAAVGDMLYRRLLPEGTGLRSDAQPNTDVLSYTDPRSGSTYRTTRGAALDMQDTRTKQNIGNVLGGGALLLGGYKLLSAVPSLRPLALPLTAGAGYLGYKAMKGPQKNVMTNEGISIPYQTEFAPPTKLGTDSITPVVVNFIEAYARNTPSGTAKQGAALLGALQKTATIDSVRGLELDSEQVAQALGDLAIC